MKHFTILTLLALVLGSPFSQAQTCNPAIPLTKPTSIYTDHGNGTVSDKQTGLMWQKCSIGQSFVAGSCTGTASTFIWVDALAAEQTANTANQFSYNTWRVPNVNELSSLIETACYNPAINNAVFPATPTDTYFWSASPYANSNDSAWVVNFGEGYNYMNNKGYSHSVRLVRGGQ